MKALEIFAATTPSKRIYNGYVMVDNILTLCDVKFHSIDTHSGDITYLVTIKGDKEVSKLMTNIHVFESVDKFKEGLEYGENFNLITFVKKVINFLDIPATLCVDNDNCDIYLVSYKFEDGEVKRVEMSSPIIYADKEKNSKKFEGLYKTREEVFAWNDIKVSENGKEYVKEGILKALSLTDDQKALVDEFLAMKEKLKENGITTFYDPDFESLSFVNTNKYDLASAYNEEELALHVKEDYEEVSDLLDESVRKICCTPVLHDIYRVCDDHFFVRKK